ncbi:cupin domain-containing protein [Bradyrhizobium sp. 180]|nr:cupin domain-containing protein [Bradyrhizobium sp. CW12]MCK1491174.1 cupin domain-containing protein [Bradyrhizobium sp. 180]MCK1530004.1 cupin domain-containing protein [Bradyrhizobium sp. 182]MCK1593879.1 cupin domain-containing protein [Bradyrhizobium sp. 164]MCK1649555.1 cupin domain-containing protein [Bradyrhizobium sp. 154]MCK1754967.1 cupin domain-containing protein [Bradyrhizobium sp. 137]
MRLALSIFATACLIGSASSQTSISRTELKRGDLTGKDMDVVVVVVEVPPGESLAKHIYPGEEIVYVLQGATLDLPDGSHRELPTGAAIINARDVPHAGFKIGGDRPLKMLNVFVVDKGKPMTEFIK